MKCSFQLKQKDEEICDKIGKWSGVWLKWNGDPKVTQEKSSKAVAPILLEYPVFQRKTDYAFWEKAKFEMETRHVLITVIDLKSFHLNSAVKHFMCQHWLYRSTGGLMSGAPEWEGD